MEWTVVAFDEKEKERPAVQVSEGSFAFNAPACALLKNGGELHYAQILTAQSHWETLVAFRFFREQEPNALPIQWREDGSAVLSDRGMVSDGLLEKRETKEPVRFGVAAEGEGGNMLRILS